MVKMRLLSRSSLDKEDDFATETEESRRKKIRKQNISDEDHFEKSMSFLGNYFDRKQKSEDERIILERERLQVERDRIAEDRALRQALLHSVCKASQHPIGYQPQQFPSITNYQSSTWQGHSPQYQGMINQPGTYLPETEEDIQNTWM